MSIKSFKTFSEDKSKEVVFTFGRFNPPTIGHEKLIKKVISQSSSNNFRIYVSQSSDPKKNPLEYREKVQLMRKMFPKYGRNIIFNKKVVNVFDILVDLYNQGFQKVTMVVGSDRVPEFRKLMSAYNGKKARHGFYEFDTINTVSAGERDPDADDVSGMSASKMRAAAAAGDLDSFSKGLPKGFGDKVGVFNLLRKRMGLKEMTNFRKHIDLGPQSILREKYIRGEIFNEGDTVCCVRTGTKFVIWERKSAFVIDGDGNKYWVRDLIEIRDTKQDKDVKDKKGTQPAKYYKGLSKSTKSRRDAHFKKGAKMDDDNPAAYKPAPGDKGAKTKPSKHTKKFKQMYGENDMEQGTKKLAKKYRKDTPGQVSEVFDQLDEKLITFAKKAYPKSGNLLILAGGAGSGKGFILNNLVGLEGKVFNVDDLKSLAIKTPKIISRVKKEFNVDLSKLKLTKGEDVAKLHDIIGTEMNLANKQQIRFFANALFQRDDLKPNVIFDVTLKDLRKLQNITRMAEAVGYKKENVHIVWVINDIEIAKVQNLDPKRARVVPVEILVNTHRGASQTMLDIMKMGTSLKKYMDGDIVFAFNKIGVDSDLKTSDKGGSYIKKSDYFYVKRSGKPPIKFSEIGDNILKKIRSYVPNANTWSLD
jgi:phosphopantetheine adenylyltransferase/predicted kinase